jgi:hypothetical protein
MDIDRRTFVKQAGGLVLFVTASAFGGANLTKTLTSFVPDKTPRGPLLVEDLTFKQSFEGVDAFVGTTRVFSANQTGTILLAAADGMHTLDEIVSESGGQIDPVEAALFYVELGKAGYLQNRVEVALVEHPA